MRPHSPAGNNDGEAIGRMNPGLKIDGEDITLRDYSMILHVDFFVVVATIYLLIFMYIHKAYDQRLNKLMIRALLFFAALAITDNCIYDFSLRTVYQPLYKPALLIGAIFRIIAVMFGMLILKRNRSMTRRELLIFLLPMLINTAVMLTGFFHDEIFMVDEHNVVHKSILAYLPHLAGFMYFADAVKIVHAMRLRGHGEEAMILGVGAVSVLLADILEIALNIHGMLVTAMQLMLTFYYLYLHMDHSKRDGMTGALTRSCFFSDLDKLRHEKLTAFCEFDMNNLKLINDRQGHLEGDKAIITMHNIIQECAPPNSHVYRFGGDEFVMVFFDVNMSTVYSTTYKIREKFAESSYGCAIGIAEWKPEMSFQEVYNVADENMYEDKKRQKEGMDPRGEKERAK